METLRRYSKPLCQGKQTESGIRRLGLIYFKRRTTKHTPSAAKSAPKPTVKPTTAAKEAKEATKETPAASAQKEIVPEENKSTRPTPQPGPPASLKRSDSKSKPKKDAAVGNLFKSFAKAKPKAKEPEKPKEDDGTSPVNRYDTSANSYYSNARHVRRRGRR